MRTVEKSMNEIDFVLPWIEGTDPEWRRCKAKYANKEDYGNNDERFRDWDFEILVPGC